MLQIDKLKFNIRTMLKIKNKKQSIKLISDNDNKRENILNSNKDSVPSLTDMEFKWIEDY